MLSLGDAWRKISIEENPNETVGQSDSFCF